MGAKKPEEYSKIRVVPVPDTLLSMLQIYIADNNLEDTDFMFTRYGIPIRKGLAEKWFSRAIQEAGILNDGLPQGERLEKLNKIAIQQMQVLETVENRKLLSDN